MGISSPNQYPVEVSFLILTGGLLFCNLLSQMKFIGFWLILIMGLLILVLNRFVTESSILFLLGILNGDQNGWFSDCPGKKLTGLTGIFTILEILILFLSFGISLRSFQDLLNIFFLNSLIYLIYLRQFVRKSHQAPQIKDWNQCKLSNGEKYCIHLVLTGKSTKEIATIKNVSSSTVRNILSKAYKKLGVAGRFELLSLKSRFQILLDAPNR